jgi:Flp pilus assembly protein TadB
MPKPEHYFLYGVAALVAIVLIYLLWPYLIGFLAIIGAAQLVNLWRRRRDHDIP